MQTDILPQIKEINSVPYSAINRFEPNFIKKWLSRVETLTRNTQFVGGNAIKKIGKSISRNR